MTLTDFLGCRLLGVPLASFWLRLRREPGSASTELSEREKLAVQSDDPFFRGGAFGTFPGYCETGASHLQGPQQEVTGSISCDYGVITLFIPGMLRLRGGSDCEIKCLLAVGFERQNRQGCGFGFLQRAPLCNCATLCI